MMYRKLMTAVLLIAGIFAADLVARGGGGMGGHMGGMGGRMGGMGSHMSGGHMNAGRGNYGNRGGYGARGYGRGGYWGDNGAWIAAPLIGAGLLGGAYGDYDGDEYDSEYYY